MSSTRLIELDGRTGEGGGQLVRVAIGLAALTSQPVRITNVRGNRQGGRGGGLKSQHVTSIQWLAAATDADVEGLSVGSKTLTFIPRRPPTELANRHVKVVADSPAASTLLILQAMLPFLLFAGDEDGAPVVLEISGGTNVTWSLSYEYLDQVLLPTLEERFGIRVERELRRRGWSLGSQSSGTVCLKIHPLVIGQSLRFRPPEPYRYPESYEVKSVDINMIVPSTAYERLEQELARALAVLFVNVEVRFKVVEDSGADARWYVLLVAHSASGLRWGADILCSMSKKTRDRDTFISQVSSKVCRDLFDEVAVGGQVDEHLQDQLVYLQALCDGFSSFPRADARPSVNTVAQTLDNMTLDGGRMRKEKAHEPFGNGSMHTQTARWVVSELLPGVEFYNKGDIVKGIGKRFT